MIDSSVVLPLPRGAHQHEQFACVYVEINAAQSQRADSTLLVLLGQAADRDCRLHFSTPIHFRHDLCGQKQ